MTRSETILPEIPPRLHIIQSLGAPTHHPLEKHNLIEKERNPSPYLPSLALEIETFSSMYPGNKLPIKAIKKLIEVGGFKRGKDDHLNYISKDEFIIEPTFGSHVTIAQELQILKDQGFLKLDKKRQNHMKEFYPIHFNIGIKPDFPERTINEPGERMLQDDWIYLRENEDATIQVETLGLSDCFIFARMFDATGWATSKERLLEPFHSNLSDDGEYMFYLNQGVSGLRARSGRYTEHHEPVTEIRTGEIWGKGSLKHFQKNLKTMQYIGAALKAYQKIPIEIKDRILLAEQAGIFKRAERLASQYEWFDHPQEKKLAVLWIKLRREGRELFAGKNLSDPMQVYYEPEFTALANCLPSGENIRKDKFKFMYNMRKLLTTYRSKVAVIIE